MERHNNEKYQPSLELFFTTMLQEIYWSELHLVDVLSSMHAAASDEPLRNAFEAHRQQTQNHVRRLEEIFDKLGIAARPVLSVGLQGIFDEGWQVIDESEEGSAQRDVALIIAAQKVEHYEIACYGSLHTLARTLGREDFAKILAETLIEEKETDILLTSIAEGGINEKASEEVTAQTLPADEKPLFHEELETND